MATGPNRSDAKIFQSQTDQYANLILILEPVHKLIHARKADTIQKYMTMLEPDAVQLAKVNALRKMLKNAEIQINQQ